MSIHDRSLRALARGIAAGVVGTGFMTLAQTLSARLRSSDGSQDEEAGRQQDQRDEQDPWEQASVPAKVAKRISEGLFDHEVSPEHISLLTHAMHWGYGSGWGAVYGLTHRSGDGRPVRRGVFFGTAVWVMSYVQLVPVGLYEPPWRYRSEEIAMEVGYHLAYGVGVASAFALLDRR